MTDQFDDLIDDLEGDNIKKNLGFNSDAVTYAFFIDDHSGSMGDNVNPADEESPVKKDLAMSNFNEQLATLKVEADDGMEVLATVIDFDNEILVPYDNVSVDDIEPLVNYWTRGMTSLYDAIAFGITKADTAMENDPRENKAVLFIIETDGYENASKDYGRANGGREKLMALIKEREATGKWTFTFLGAGLDEKFAQDIGFSTGNIATTRAGNVGDTVYAYAAQTRGLKNFMSDRKNGVFAKSDFYHFGAKNEDEEGEIK